MSCGKISVNLSPGVYRVTDAQNAFGALDAVGSHLEPNRCAGFRTTRRWRISRIRVIGGNFITGQPIGVLDGIDMHCAGKARKVDSEGLMRNWR